MTWDLHESTTLTIVLLYAVALVSTIARLLYRWYTKRLWWEDIWATVAGVCAVVGLTSLLLYDGDLPWAATINRISEWLESTTFTIGLWAARLSIFLSLIRVSNPTGISRCIALSCVVLFLLMCAALTAQKIYYCAVYQCVMLQPVAVTQLVTDITSDTILVLGPILLLRDVRLSKNRRILILSAFSSSILISAVSITHSVLMLVYVVSPLTLAVAELKLALSLFICNILVMVTFAYRILRRRGKRQGIDLDASFGEDSPLNLTTIDLNQSTAGTLSGGGDPTSTAVSRTPNVNITTGGLSIGEGTEEWIGSQGTSSSSNHGHLLISITDESDSLAMVKSQKHTHVDSSFDSDPDKAEERLAQAV